MLHVAFACVSSLALQSPPPDEARKAVEAAYEKREVRIPMRDGAKLFTSIYVPRDRSHTWPILMRRTPYSVRPYGEKEFPSAIGPSKELETAGYVFVLQDVRGCYMSEGEFVDMRPHRDSKAAGEIDESTDTHDTIEWLVRNLEEDNGKVGMWGISYPGFYAAAGMIDAHPALAAVSPQAPIADWFFDDFHHHGAFFLPHAFNFLAGFGRPRPLPTTERSFRFDHGTQDGYQFFLDLGSLDNANERFFKGEIATWNDMALHPNYDEFWQARNLLPHLDRVAPAVMTVGGWFDAEDLYGPLRIYREVERRNPGVFNVLVMGPWSHGGWSRATGESLGTARFGSKTSEHYRAAMEARFFEHFLKGAGEHGLAEANVFETGANRWRAFDAWPPRNAIAATWHVGPDGSLASTNPAAEFEPYEFVSDPARPVPFTQAIERGMTREYMTDDQRFAARRPDVLVFATEPLTVPVTLAGPVFADLVVSTTREDADWIVKLIDVIPPNADDEPETPAGFHLGGCQRMVRSEVLRGRFRDDYSKPKPFVPGEPTPLTVTLQDVLHTFEPGHRIMIHVQSTWFPLVDRNPQKWVDNIFAAREEDFVAATHRLHAGSKLRVSVLPAGEQR